MANLSVFDKKRLAVLQKKADGGSITAIQVLAKYEREQKLQAAKDNLIGESVFSRPENEGKQAAKELLKMPNDRDISSKINALDISEIEKFIEKGEFRQLPEEMMVYLNWMQEAHDWYYKFKSRTWVMRFLLANCSDQNGNLISHYMAEKIFNDMLSFFYADKNFKRNSWYRYLAERIEMSAALALEDNDFETFGKNMERAAKVMAMITVEKHNIDPRLLDRRPRFFVTKTSELGLSETNRYKLAKQIDEMEISERQKISAKQDLGVEEREFGTVKEELENEAE